MQTARIVTGAAMALWIGVGLVPSLRPYAGTIRGVVLALYLVGCVAFVGYVAVWR
jgi:hypothetical protein